MNKFSFVLMDLTWVQFLIKEDKNLVMVLIFFLVKNFNI